MLIKIVFIFITIVFPSQTCLADTSKESFAIITTGELNDNQGNKVNYYKAPKYKNTSSPQNRKKKKNTVITKTIDWNWKINNHNTDSGKFNFTATNNHIDTTRVCNNYYTGSLTYKNCRNAAKVWFKKQCLNGYKAACPASAMRP